MKVSLFLDVEDLEQAAEAFRCSIDYGQVRKFLIQNREVFSSYAFIPLDPKLPYTQDLLMTNLWENEYIVKTKLGRYEQDQLTCNIEMDLAVHVLKTVYEQDVDGIILVTNNPDFSDLIVMLRELGVWVELVTFSDSIPQFFTLRANSVIDLREYMVQEVEEEEQCEENTVEEPKEEDQYVLFQQKGNEE